MRTWFLPRDVLESATNVSSELNYSIRVLNFTRNDSDITKRTMSYTIDGGNSSFTDDLSDSWPLNYIPSLTIIDSEDKMAEEYAEYYMRGEFLVS